jgi:hypothetical protein
MNPQLVKKAKKIIEKIIYITLASVTPDGKPWNTIVFTGFDKKYNFYWRSYKNSVHSQNIESNGDIFITICDTTSPWGEGKGVFIKAHAEELTDKNDISTALALLDKRSPRSLGSTNDFLDESPRRVYKAVTEKMWINDAEEIDGNFVDKRIEIHLA